VGANEAIDFFDEVSGGIERAATDSALSDEGEEALDLIARPHQRPQEHRPGRAAAVALGCEDGAS